MLGVAPAAADCFSARQALLMARYRVGEAVLEETAAGERYIAARSESQPRRFSCASTRSASGRLIGPVGFLFIGASTSTFRSAAPKLPLCAGQPYGSDSASASGSSACSRRSRRLGVLPATLGFLLGRGAPQGTPCRSSCLSRRCRLRVRPLLQAPFSFCRCPVSPDSAGVMHVNARASFRRVCSRFAPFLDGRRFFLAPVLGACYRQRSCQEFSGPSDVADLHAPSYDARCPLSEIDKSASFLREQIGVIDRQREALDRRRAPLVEALAVLERDGSDSAPVAAGHTSSEEEDPPRLADRIMQLLQKNGPLNRRQLLSALDGLDVKPGTIDSAAYRLVKRGRLHKRGARFAAVEPEPHAVGSRSEPVASRSSASASAPDRSSGPLDVGLDDGVVHTGGNNGVVAGAETPVFRPAHGVPDADPALSIRARVLAAVSTGVACTRRDLIRHFGVQGLTEEQVRNALSGLRRRGKLREVAGGVIEVVGSAAPSGRAHAGSHGS